MRDLTAEYSAVAGDLHRKKYGQFFTEERVARFMIRWTLSGTSSSAFMFDPSFGLGVFHDAARSLGFRGEYRGAEIDPKIFSFFQDHNDAQGCYVDNVDYLTVWKTAYPAIVCNPPYMRFQKVAGRVDVLSTFQKKLGIKLSGYTNIASAFLVKSISELSEGGRLAYIMPLEFLNAGYGKVVKRLLLEQGSLSAIVRIDCERDAFPDATTSVGVVLFEKRKSNAPVRFFVVNDLDQLENLQDGDAVSNVSAISLQPDEKWLRFFDRSLKTPHAEHLVSLSEYGRFSRGIATGANEFFALNRETVARLGLANSEISPCITKSAQIRKSVFRPSDLSCIAEKNAAVFLLNLNGALSDGAQAYVEYGEQQGFNGRYLTRTRSPWYKVENRTPSPLLFGVFSRGGFKVIRNYTNALNLTCYHGFQPNIFGQEFVDHLFLYFQSMAGRHILCMNMRRYGDSLDKFEPNDLNDAMCPSMDFLGGIERNKVINEIAYLEEHGTLSDEAESMFSGLLSQTQFPIEEVRHAA